MAIKARYTGSQGEYLDRIPARNLSDEEYDALDTEQKRLVRSSGIYDVRSDAKAQAPAVKAKRPRPAKPAPPEEPKVDAPAAVAVTETTEGGGD